ncbi:hypothetical protein [Nitrosospira sp. Nsp14]|uniref:hypothetical protein n=1 Tax=Nitrosospira sp. Nsp14 TaxID=1855333 RepID=UPI0015A51226|nr:hypothetical protein [Nitrosospira sp. Nsp14]
MLISMGAYAIPLAYNDITLAQDESGDDRGISSISGVASKTDEMIALLLVSSYLGRPPGDEKVLSLGNSQHGFALLFEFPSASGLPWPDGNLTRFPAFGFLPNDAGDADQIALLDNDENEVIDFLALLGIVTAVWEPSEEHSERIHDTGSATAQAPAGVRRGPRDACVQWHNEQSNKHGWHESLCADTGFVSTGFNGPGTRFGRGGIVTGGGIGGVVVDGTNPNRGNNPGGVAAVPVGVAVPAGVAPVIVAALALGPKGGMEMAVRVQVAVATAQAGKTTAPSLQPKLVPFRNQPYWPW